MPSPGGPDAGEPGRLTCSRAQEDLGHVPLQHLTVRTFVVCRGQVDHVAARLPRVELDPVPEVVGQPRTHPQAIVGIHPDVTPVVERVHVRAQRQPVADLVLAAGGVGPNVGGVQHGRKSERIEFTTVDAYPGLYIQAVGETESGSKVGIAIGPQYGTVSQKYAKDAVRGAIQAGDIDLLCLLGFAFDAQTSDVSRPFQRPSSGRIAVLLARTDD
jgi:hypothetical protein